MTSSRWTAGALIVAVVGGTALLVAATGHDVGRAATALVSGSVGSWYAFGSGTLIRATHSPSESCDASVSSQVLSVTENRRMRAVYRQ